MIPVSLLPILAHIIFHTTLVATATKKEPYGHPFPNCSSSERMLRQLGLQRLDNASIANILRLVLPDVLVLITSIVTLVLARAAFKIERLLGRPPNNSPSLRGQVVPASKNLFRVILDFTQNTLLVAAGVIVPSILGVMYFLVFLAILTLWGCYKSTGIRFGFLRILLLFYTGSHLVVLHLYQFQFFQDALDPSDLAARLLGLTAVVYTDCADVDSILFHDGLRWSVFANFGLLLALYWILSYNVTIWRRRMKGSDHPAYLRWLAWQESHESLASAMSGAGSRQRFPAQSQNETGSMVFSGSYNEEEEPEDEPREDQSRRVYTDRSRLMDNSDDQRQYGSGRVSRRSTTSDNVDKGSDKIETGAGSQGDVVSETPNEVIFEMNKRKAWMSVIVLIMRQSYVLSLIAMMAWSITYHSWLTFVFLLSACFLWMMPNSRKSCLRTSPFVLIYAELLLLAGYIFNMNLEKELPTTVGTYQLSEVGLKRFTDPSLHLGLQAFYTLFLVLTMRQYLSEAHEQPGEEEQGICLQTPRPKTTFLEKLKFQEAVLMLCMVFLEFQEAVLMLCVVFLEFQEAVVMLCVVFLEFQEAVLMLCMVFLEF
ncbi:piezo-type mechanosensitive ion channel component [Plakobranchus ocellatus]|uniref:Piezo-type mechanosensitive ion channel component n=1 Tax=Plakobranchus ocellatus TaxID=259542 RepID=A0AAV4CCK4_9GAST|nr:piezo-type mechanosensitive ion channel component [Plakobranchus ocellatus]